MSYQCRCEVDVYQRFGVVPALQVLFVFGIYVRHQLWFQFPRHFLGFSPVLAGDECVYCLSDHFHTHVELRRLRVAPDLNQPRTCNLCHFNRAVSV
jgi:hypothetical protein